MPVFPFELFRHIITVIGDDVDKSTHYHRLSAISLSCRLLRHEAQRVLFRNPGELHTSSATQLKTMLFIDTVVSSLDRLALYVKIFAITFDDWFHPNFETPAFVQKLSNALQAMRNLESLNVVQWTSNARSLSNILQDVQFELSSFSWFGHPLTMSEVTNSKIEFLQRQNKIKHLAILEFLDESALKAIAADISPFIRSLSMPFSLSEIILPGKQYLTSLQWVLPRNVLPSAVVMHNNENIAPRLRSISRELERLRYICYQGGSALSPVGPQIQHIAPYLTNLVCLEISRDSLTVRVSILLYAQTGSIRPIQQWEALSRLPRLKILILNTDGFANDPPHVDDVTRIAALSNCLEWIDIEDNYGRFSRVEYCHSSKSARVFEIGQVDQYIWTDDCNIFDD